MIQETIQEKGLLTSKETQCLEEVYRVGLLYGISPTDLRQLINTRSTVARGWIGWTGGICPVGNDALVVVQFRGVDEPGYKTSIARHFDWAHTSLPKARDILAYKLLTED